MDWVDFIEPDDLVNARAWKTMVIKTLKGCRLLKPLGLTFSHVTLFICIK